MDLVERRIGLLFALFLGLLAIAAVRAGYMGVVKGGGLSNVASSQQVDERVVPARRGAITDRHGAPLATSEPADDVSATPYLVKNPVAVAAKLAPILGVEEATLVKELARRDTGFVYLARRLPADKADKVKALGLEGVDLTPGYLRAYPRGMLASQVIGAVGTDGNGLFGLEYERDKALRGRDGEQRTVFDGGRDAISVRDVAPTVPGAGLRLTLDAEVQARTEEVLQGVGETFRPKGASAIVMDPRSGHVLAMANWPRINANDPGSAPAWATQNRAVGFTFEPGSTFKAFTVAGALEDGEVTPSTSFNLPPKIQVADRLIGESHDRGYVTLDTAGIVAQSSNVGSIMIGQRLGAKRFDHWVRRFGFGRPTGVALPGEEQGVVLDLDDYSGSSMGNLPIGQGELVTPIQMAAAYSAIANGGVLRTPQIVQAVDGRPVRRAPGRRVVSSRTAFELRKMLAGVFAPGGTASEVAIPGYELAGKTGTANKVDAASGTYSEERYVASFVGMAPAERPRLLISVLVDEPKGAIYGGEVAAPAFGKIASFALPYLRIPPS
ncbi:MAG: penicillin-binding protein 2 [Solirubrobacteraceae bacterium]|jgi:cell division protein FtsI/penicillin-binding protein 2|nr:penicillin-binding protein 2 [Solirubrobacteraceae bacterium]